MPQETAEIEVADDEVVEDEVTEEVAVVETKKAAKSVPQPQEKKEAAKSVPQEVEFAFGAYGVSDFSIDEFSKYMLCDVGGGISFESSLPIDFLGGVGLSVRLQGCFVVKAWEQISSYWNSAAFIGIWTRLPIAKNIVFFQPEVSYGVYLHRLKTVQAVENPIDCFYMDQALQISPMIRILPRKLFNRKIEFILSPIYKIMFEKGRLLNFFGARFGLVYKFGGKKDEKTNP